MDDYQINLIRLDSSDPQQQLSGLSFFAVLKETELSDEVMDKLIELSENASSQVAEVAGSIISQTVTKREHKALEAIVIKKLRSDNPEKLTMRDFDWSVKLKTKPLKKALESYLEKCTDPIHVSWLVKNLPKHYPDHQQVAILKSFLTWGDDRIVANTIEGLEYLKDADTTHLFIKMLLHPSHRVRAMAAKALAMVNPESTQVVIEQMLQKIDEPDMIKAACYAIKNLKCPEQFLKSLIPLLEIKQIKESAINTVAWIIFQQVSDMLKASGFEVDNTKKAAVINSVVEELKKQCCRNCFYALEQLSEPDTCNIRTEEKDIRLIIPKVEPENAKQIAEKNKRKTLSFFARLIYRPTSEDIKLVSFKSAYIPFWHIVAQANVEYVREKPFKMNFEENVKEIKIGDNYYKIDNNTLDLPVHEKCNYEKTGEICLDAVNSEKVSLKYVDCEHKPPSPENDKDQDINFVTAKVKAATILRDLIHDLMSPLKAIEIIEQKVLIKKLLLYYRPVYCFEYYWEDKDKKLVVEVDGVTGKISQGRNFKTMQKAAVSQNHLFDIGADAIGLVIPGGEIAAKLALALMGKRK